MIIMTRTGYLEDYALINHLSENIKERMAISLDFLEMIMLTSNGIGSNSFLDELSKDISFKIAKSVH